MSKKTFVSIIFIIISLCLISCSGESQESQEVSANEDLPNLIIQVEGDAHIRRTGWSDFLPLAFGATVKPGDLIRVENGSLVIFCGAEDTLDDGPITLEASDQEQGIPCKTGLPPRPWEDVAHIRGAGDLDIPYIISPRNTALLSTTPTLRWNPVPGSDSYSVSIMDELGKPRPEIESSETEIDWPSEWQPLAQDSTYILQVKTGSVSSMDQNTAGTGFWLLPSPEANQVAQHADRIRSLTIDESTTNFLIAKLYGNHGLYAEAVQLLEQTAAQRQEASIWLELSKAYLEMGLSDQAEETLEKALDLSQEKGQTDIEANALLGMGYTAQKSGDEAMAIDYWQQASTVFKEIGDMQSLALVNELLEK